MLGGLVAGFVAILIGASLIPTIADQIDLARNNNQSWASVDTRVTGSAGTILDLTTLFFALAVAMAGLAIAAQAMRVSGIV